MLSAAAAATLPAQTVTTLHSFDSTDGAHPYAALLQGTTGNLYGTTGTGGPNGFGTALKMTLGGTVSTLYGFCSKSGCADGEYSQAALVEGTSGNFYGTLPYGGVFNSTCPYGCGTVFKMTPGGALTTLYSFCSQTNCTDGANPLAALVEGTDGNFYGTTYGGGANASGTVFKITPGGTLSVIYNFCSESSCTDGEVPVAGLVQAIDGNFYGTTEFGGAANEGTVFKVSPGGTLSTLYSFCSKSKCADGDAPAAALVQALDGNFYGTTSGGGANAAGTVFKVSSAGSFTALYSFCSQSDCADGDSPYASLVQATDGNLYGTTLFAGAHQSGTIFKITTSGALTTLYSFCAKSLCADGQYPSASLVQDTSGKFYGTTSGGGSSNACNGGCGTVFSLAVGLGPFAETLPGSGKVGTHVGILGNTMTGATSVTFNGTAAVFKVASNSLITTTVPSGATTGTVKVVTPGGTLSSNVPFQVLP